jgi:hypothetical protein
MPTSEQKSGVSLTDVRFLKALILKQVSTHTKDCLSSSSFTFLGKGFAL